MQTRSRYRWFVVVVFFIFILLHQSDKLLIGPLTTPIMEAFGIDEVKMGAVVTGALLVGTLLYPLWGYLYDRYTRSKLLALASFIWGTTTWLSAIAPTYSTFMITRASTGVDDSSYPGLYSLISDYFSPSMRGKVFGMLQIGQPLGYMIGLLMATMLSGIIGWRNIFIITGSLGLVMAVVIFFGVKEPPRGQSEPEMEGLEQVGVYKFNWGDAKGLFRKRTLIFLYIQGFIGVFPWNVITYWFFRYLETERHFNPNEVLMTMGPAILVLAGGYFVGGAIGDAVFKRIPRGRLITSLFGVISGAVLLYFTMNVPLENKLLFQILLMLTALFIPFASPNVISTVYDVTLPEIRSTALSVEYFIENFGAALAPLLAGFFTVNIFGELGQSILVICLAAWAVDAFFLLFVTYFVPADIRTLRTQLDERAEHERKLQEAAARS